MGYSTQFKGTLKFKDELKASQLAEINKFLSQDRREIGFSNDADVYTTKDEYWYHIDLELTDDYSGLKWNGSEKTYGMEFIINFITKQMKKVMPNFELTGKLTAQGEDIDDRYEVIMEKGIAKKRELKVVGKKIKCPHCEEYFILEDKKCKGSQKGR
jgi:hypothetical protein